jgi:hypothetical protein
MDRNLSELLDSDSEVEPVVKLSKSTIQLLKSFVNINKHLVVHRGNVLKTILPTQDFMVRAEVAETFPLDFGTHDLRQLINVISQFDEPEIKFKKDHMVVTESSSKSTPCEAQYDYSDILNLEAPADDGYEMENVAVEFDLSKANLTAILDAFKKLGHEQIEIKGGAGRIDIITSRITTKGEKVAARSFKVTVGQTPHSFGFKTHGAFWKLLMPTAYRIQLSFDGAIHLSDTQGLDYWMMVMDESYFKS